MKKDSKFHVRNKIQYIKRGKRRGNDLTFTCCRVANGSTVVGPSLMDVVTAWGQRVARRVFSFCLLSLSLSPLNSVQFNRISVPMHLHIGTVVHISSHVGEQERDARERGAGSGYPGNYLTVWLTFDRA